MVPVFMGSCLWYLVLYLDSLLYSSSLSVFLFIDPVVWFVACLPDVSWGFSLVALNIGPFSCQWRNWRKLWARPRVRYLTDRLHHTFIHKFFL